LLGDPTSKEATSEARFAAVKDRASIEQDPGMKPHGDRLGDACLVAVAASGPELSPKQEPLLSLLQEGGDQIKLVVPFPFPTCSIGQVQKRVEGPQKGDKPNGAACRGV
jgi:hypothetical protein